jgi:putative salt-induced outer membrane protein
MFVADRRLLLATPFCLIATPAHAGSLDAVRAMFETAVLENSSKSLDTVAKVAKQTWPEDEAAIDGLLATYRKKHKQLSDRRAEQERERIQQAGLFERWKGEGELGGFRSTGNSRTLGISAGLKLKREGVIWENQLRLRVDYQKDRGKVTREQYLAAYSPRFTLDDRLYAYGLIQYERDRFQGYNARYTLSGGAGYRVLRGGNISLALEGGPAIRRTEAIGEPDETKWSALASLDLDWQIGERLKFTQDANAFIEADNSTFTSATAIEGALSKAIKARLSYTVEHDTNPPPDALSTDTLSRATLVFGF